eukprot:CAMPEP_0119044714 /NCGR_PEP_ID=MMETSP1177-20130426/33816_1 /TAXON_ID=2985 /ORGANISM="Ochromonas sp, Strain CCMP1899" /LENGTH=599 /DNA_ID=CAMNT_0007015247 /DNA_START=233 /DNA_END=2029 /DNA_ORIENTATION=+
MKNKGVSASASTGAGNDNNMASRADNTNDKAIDNWQIGLSSKNDGSKKSDTFRNKGDEKSIEDVDNDKNGNESLSDEMIKENGSLSRNDNNSNNSMNANNDSISLDSTISNDVSSDLSSSKNSIREGVQGIVLDETKGVSGSGSQNTPSSSSSSSAVYSSRIDSRFISNASTSFIEHYCDYEKSTEYNYSMKRLSESLKKQMKVANETSGAFYVTDTDTLLIDGKKVDSLGKGVVSKDDLSESDVSLSGEIIDVKNNISNLKKLNNALIKSGNEELADDLQELGKRKLSDASMNIEEEESPIYVGKYARERSELDYTFHEHYIPERQLFHDILIDQFFQTLVTDKNSGLSCERPRDNWLVFTAGCMGAGKGHTVSWLHSQGLFPLEAFVRVDPDALRELLPETEEYIRRDPKTAGYLTQKEVGYICEVLTISGLEKGKNVLVDGSLRDASWYYNHIGELRKNFPKLKIAIIYVTADQDTILSRSAKRGAATGRVVPEEVILRTMQDLPRSIRMLSPIVDFVATFENKDNTDPTLLHSIWDASSHSFKTVDSEHSIKSDTPPERSEQSSDKGDAINVVEEAEGGRELGLGHWREEFKAVW